MFSDATLSPVSRITDIDFDAALCSVDTVSTNNNNNSNRSLLRYNIGLLKHYHTTEY